MIIKYEESYLNPETAKKVMTIKRQFKEEKDRINNEYHRAKELTHEKERE